MAYRQDQSFTATLTISDWDGETYRGNDNGTPPPVGFFYTSGKVYTTGATKTQLEEGYDRYAYNQTTNQASYLVATRIEPLGKQQSFHFMCYESESDYDYKIRVIGGPYDGKYLGRSPEGYVYPYGESSAQWFHVNLGLRGGPITPKMYGYIGVKGKDYEEKLRTYSYTTYPSFNNWWAYLTFYGAGHETRLNLHVRHVKVPEDAKPGDYGLS
ncbi:hypothetical protein ACFCXT_10600 [Streptomyces vinaceus]|uniref:hypothetical protein n=1 Tax=Streptomyces vinaceus TaxID=1960 RepID=UPI0035DC8EE1